MDDLTNDQVMEYAKMEWLTVMQWNDHIRYTHIHKYVFPIRRRIDLHLQIPVVFL